MLTMKIISILGSLLVLLMNSFAESGSPCPFPEKVYPCFCTNLSDGQTLVMCPGIQNTSHLQQVTQPMKSMIVDRLMLLNIFDDRKNVPDISENIVDTKAKVSDTGIFPKKWLAELRVRELEIQHGDLSNCFLCDEALEGQSDFLTSLVVKNANLGGHICSTCSLGSISTSMSTRELRRIPLLKHLDFSQNNIEVVDGNAFPSVLKELTKITLSDNKINRIHDNAFSNLHLLTELDLSRNQLTSVSRKIFRNSDSSLKVIDMSYNSIQVLPEDMFHLMNGLREVKLAHNLLETLPATTWTRIPALLEKIDLRGNFLVCNCTMNWFPRRLSKSTKMVGHCIAPKEVEFQELKPTLSSITTCS